MLSYYLKCKRHTADVDPNVSKTKNSRTQLSSKYTVCSSKKSRFIKKQEAKGLLKSLGIKTPLSNSTLIGKILS